MNNEPAPKFYFQNLNSIRFIAALMVMIAHVNQFKGELGLSGVSEYKIFLLLGQLGVTIFFVLSGFLISFLLLKEQEITRNISIKSFYIRRILRIWPLYFLIILTAFFVLPFIDVFDIPSYNREFIWSDLPIKLILYSLLLPNVALNIYGIIPYASQTWSIGAEEQFYFIWPILNKYFKNKWALMFGVIVFYLSVKILLYFLPKNEFIHVLKDFWWTFPVDCMAIGGMFALIITDTSDFVKQIRIFLYRKITQWIVLISTMVLLFSSCTFPLINNEVYSLLFGYLILNFADNKSRIFSMENPLLNYLGKISYGLYMYHAIVIVLVIKVLEIDGAVNNLLLYPIVLLIVILISAFSYQFFELPFIKRKLKYSKITSG